MRVFADTASFIGLLNRRDAAHEKSLSFSRQRFREVVLTEFILLELADAFSRPPDRADFLMMDGHVRRTDRKSVV